MWRVSGLAASRGLAPGAGGRNTPLLGALAGERAPQSHQPIPAPPHHPQQQALSSSRPHLQCHRHSGELRFAQTPAGTVVIN